MKKVTKIVLNGVEYDGVDQMPPDVRQQYQDLMSRMGQDADGDGVPDALQKPGSSNVVVKESITYNGKTYNSRDELPPDVRAMLDQMPQLQPGQDHSQVEIKTTRVFPSHTSISGEWGPADEDQPGGITLRLSWWLVAILAVAVLILLALWLSGVKPSQLWH